jgi:hypothetical protein
MRPLVKDDEVPFEDEAPLKESVKGSQGADKAKTAAILV